jgi:hypothetical protein
LSLILISVLLRPLTKEHFFDFEVTHDKAWRNHRSLELSQVTTGVKNKKAVLDFDQNIISLSAQEA